MKSYKVDSNNVVIDIQTGIGIKTSLLISMILFLVFNGYAQVGINSDGSAPSTSAILDVKSSDKGILIPRMTLNQRTQIPNPAEGLLVYQTDAVSGFYYFNGSNWVKLLDTDKDGNPIGSIIRFSLENVPDGYLECNGAAVSRTTYANLFAVIGTRYGVGDGSTTFNLPDYRGQFLRGYDHGAGTDPDASTRIDSGNGTTGDAVGTKQNDLTLSHRHVVDPPETSTNTAGDHNHSIPVLSGLTSAVTPHYHSVSFGLSQTSNESDNHTHKLIYDTDELNDGSTQVVRSFIQNPNLPNTHFTFTDNELENHNHLVSYFGAQTESAGAHSHNFTTNTSNTGDTGAHYHTVDIASFSTENTGGLENRPKNITVMYCIKY